MSLLERIQKHFDPIRVRRLEVPEWGEDAIQDADGAVATAAKPLIVTYLPVTLDDLALVQETDGDNYYHRAARMVCLKAMDETGKKLFTMLDAITLRESANPAVVTGLFVKMCAGLSLDQAVKN